MREPDVDLLRDLKREAEEIARDEENDRISWLESREPEESWRDE